MKTVSVRMEPELLSRLRKVMYEEDNQLCPEWGDSIGREMYILKSNTVDSIEEKLSLAAARLSDVRELGGAGAAAWAELELGELLLALESCWRALAAWRGVEERTGALAGVSRELEKLTGRLWRAVLSGKGTLLAERGIRLDSSGEVL